MCLSHTPENRKKMKVCRNALGHVKEMDLEKCKQQLLRTRKSKIIILDTNQSLLIGIRCSPYIEIIKTAQGLHQIHLSRCPRKQKKIVGGKDHRLKEMIGGKPNLDLKQQER